uniref:Uncharacterized protein n=1 Tax=Parascaris univalens TaxID=6257 RepID=A0A914ZVE8_PARUN
SSRLTEQQSRRHSQSTALHRSRLVHQLRVLALRRPMPTVPLWLKTEHRLAIRISTSLQLQSVGNI